MVQLMSAVNFLVDNSVVLLLLLHLLCDVLLVGVFKFRTNLLCIAWLVWFS